MIFANITKLAPDAHIVIQKSQIRYLAPIKKDFIAECELTDEARRTKFLDMYRRHKKAKLKLNNCCYDHDILLAAFEG